MLSVNNPVLGPLATLQANLFDDSASRYAIGARYYFNEWASWYVVGSVLTQGQALTTASAQAATVINF